MRFIYKLSVTLLSELLEFVITSRDFLVSIQSIKICSRTRDCRDSVILICTTYYRKKYQGLFYVGIGGAFIGSLGNLYNYGYSAGNLGVTNWAIKNIMQGFEIA
ncbi:uncharacterized protein NMK_0528 [Novimethylophilus kurashikiensis]|uniref:Uncharacterized protein n=1 Tax=Novimethylophilus kurashikiensis TaxID=1825523 RepID=A0A2R5F371_9PROT|nr:uncharacterized protein NMK_0528 [Novimethylophilus kurashikiensis]